MPRSRLVIPGIACALLVVLSSCHHHHSNPPPTAFDQSFSMFEDDSLSDALDADNVDFDTSTFFIDAAPLHGELEVNPDTGDFTYTPDEGFVGSDNFFWDVDDRFGDSNVAEVDIDVEPATAIRVIHLPGQPLLASLR
jgi:hypothetical protein